jgi:hypothetical protein
MRDLPKGRCTGSGFFVYISKYAATNALLPEDEHSVSLLKRMLDPAQQHYTKEKNVTGREFCFWLGSSILEVCKTQAERQPRVGPWSKKCFKRTVQFHPELLPTADSLAAPFTSGEIWILLPLLPEALFSSFSSSVVGSPSSFCNQTASPSSAVRHVSWCSFQHLQ